MTEQLAPVALPEVRRTWLPMMIIALGQAQMSFNVNALPVSLEGIVAEFDAGADDCRHDDRKFHRRGRLTLGILVASAALRLPLLTRLGAIPPEPQQAGPVAANPIPA